MKRLFRYIRRLILWFERPLPREEWMSAFRLGEKSMEAKMKAQRPTFQPAVPAVPAVQSPARQQLQPLTIRQRALLERMRATLKPVEQETSPLLPAVPVVQLDDSWLNSKPVQESPRTDTESVPAIMKLKWERT